MKSLLKELTELKDAVDGMEAGSVEWEETFRDIENIEHSIKSITRHAA